MANQTNTNGRITIIDLLYLAAVAGASTAFAEKAIPITGMFFAIVIGIITFFFILELLGLFFRLLEMLSDLVFCPFPSKCEYCKSEWFLNEISECIATEKCAITGVKVNLLLIRCKCNRMYFLGSDVLMKVNEEDGLLLPYMRRTTWRGWRKDNGIKIPDSVNPEVIDQTREKWKKLQEKLIFSPPPPPGVKIEK